MLYKSIVMPKQLLDNHLLEEESLRDLFKKFLLILWVLCLMINGGLFGIGLLLVEGINEGWEVDIDTLNGWLFMGLLSVPVLVFYWILHSYFNPFFRKYNKEIILQQLYTEPKLAEYAVDRTGKSVAFNGIKGIVLLILFALFLEGMERAIVEWIIERVIWVLFIMYFLNLIWMMGVEIKDFSKKFTQVFLQEKNPPSNS